MTFSIMQKVAVAKRSVPEISVQDAMTLTERNDVVIGDVRDAPELADGCRIYGALNISRGMLEFRADETSPYHNCALTKTKTIILYCASGGRSALCGHALLEMGYPKVFNLGAFKDWVLAGGPTAGATD
jgi:rhodanese-related sulfurtransferase